MDRPKLCSEWSVMKTKTLIRFCAMAVALIASAPSADAAESQPKKPNVLFIAVDDLRTEFGAYGSKFVKSPNLDRLAARGVTFTRAYCQQAVCSPSRSSVMTGTRPDSTKVWDLNTHFRVAQPDVVTLPQHFKTNGYHTEAMGKIYHPGFDDERSWSVPTRRPVMGAMGKVRIEQEKITPLPQQQAAQANAAKAQTKKAQTKKAQTKKAQTNANATAARGPAFASRDVPDNGFPDGVLAEMAVAALRERKSKNEPFFLAVGFFKPHLPFNSPKRYWDLYNPKEIALAPNPFRPKDAPEFAITDYGELRSYSNIPKEGRIPDDLARQLKHGYYAALSYMDAQVGQVLDELDKLGLSENTIIVLWGDHGWKLGEHDAWCKHSNVENDANAPLLVAAPTMAKTAGRKCSALVEFVDIYPTLTELAGLTLPSHLEGTSLAPLLSDPDKPWKTAAFSQYPRPQNRMGYSMRTDRYRFTQWVQRDNHDRVLAIELYDHQTDPQENANIADRPENAELVKRLKDQWRQGWKGAMPPSANHAQP